MPCRGAGAVPLQNACRVNSCAALSVDPLAPPVTLEQPEHCLSTMPAPGRTVNRTARPEVACQRNLGARPVLAE